MSDEWVPYSDEDMDNILERARLTRLMCKGVEPWIGTQICDDAERLVTEVKKLQESKNILRSLYNALALGLTDKIKSDMNRAEKLLGGSDEC